MIILDPRAGSGDLRPLLEARHAPVKVRRLPAADAEWYGWGPDGPVLVGTEIKKIKDLMDCIKDKRLVGFQLPRLLKRFDVVYLLVEGGFRQAGRKLEIKYTHRMLERWGCPKGASNMSYGSIDGYLTTLVEQVEGGSKVRVHRTWDREETAEWLVAKHRWWSKEWDRHRALRGEYRRTRSLKP